MFTKKLKPKVFFFSDTSKIKGHNYDTCTGQKYRTFSYPLEIFSKLQLFYRDQKKDRQQFHEETITFNKIGLV